ncbi:MAG: hypothetical protein ACYDH1_02710 [Anaerolineaceae bacterium]
MSPIFSYFNYRTRQHPATTGSVIPVIRFQLEESDREVGRFWVGLLHAFRTIFPGIGQRFLVGIVDHHQQPAPTTIAQLTNELEQKNWELILENSDLIRSENWWSGFVEWLQPFKEKHSIVFLEDSGKMIRKAEEELIHGISPGLRIALTASEIWWPRWFSEEFPGENCTELWHKLRVANNIKDFSSEIILPKRNLLISLQNQLRREDQELLIQQILSMIDWLQDQGEWLEAVRLMQNNKDFEQAGEILQDKVEDWLSSGADPLEVLFWLKELPGVLLTSRPGLCLLAARAAYKLGFNFQVSYFISAAENNLYALQHFSRNDKLWREMVLDESGTTVQGILDQITQIRIGENHETEF